MSARTLPVIGSWPEDCVQRAFVAGAVWWMWRVQHCTPFGTEREEMEAEAVKRYGDPLAEPSVGAETGSR